MKKDLSVSLSLSLIFHDVKVIIDYNYLLVIIKKQTVELGDCTRSTSIGFYAGLRVHGNSRAATEKDHTYS